jgi:hypothetical protein
MVERLRLLRSLESAVQSGKQAEGVLSRTEQMSRLLQACQLTSSN